MYQGLKNNVSTRLMQTKLHTWPEGTNDFVGHEILKQYIQDIATKTEIEKAIRYGARVTEINKKGPNWSLNYTRLEPNRGVEKHTQVGNYFPVQITTLIYLRRSMLS